ncbi:MAG TPA: hypothetical protein VLH38_00240 [Patescibacteria group bacterium]|nr:hypothetical protein [Patescibacteria group bacterium]
MLSVHLWGVLVTRRNTSETKWTFIEATLLLGGIVVVTLALTMMVVVMDNLQSAVVPIANTLQFG